MSPEELAVRFISKAFGKVNGVEELVVFDPDLVFLTDAAAKAIEVFVFGVDVFRLQLQCKWPCFDEHSGGEKGLISAGRNHLAVVERIWVVGVVLLLPGDWKKR